MSNKTSDKNVANDIKILKKFCEYEEAVVLTDNALEEVQDAINNILAERKQDKKKIQELEEENRIYVLEGNRVKLGLYIKENYILKQKVIEALDDIYDYLERLNGPDEDIEYIENKRRELLEDK